MFPNKWTDRRAQHQVSPRAEADRASPPTTSSAGGGLQGYVCKRVADEKHEQENEGSWLGDDDYYGEDLFD